MIEIPTLDTERLMLRGWRESDLDGLAAIFGDADVARFVGGVQSRSDAWRTLSATIGHWVLRGYGLWAVTRKSDNALVGRVGIHYPLDWPGIEVAWTLGRPYWGQGYATEAAAASVRFGFAQLGLPRLVSLIDPRNRASQRVAERLGETKGAPATVTVFGRVGTVDVWSIERPR
ncbi:MAG: GNAT family N-acetyltransferase [Stellaceae bacterium]